MSARQPIHVLLVEDDEDDYQLTKCMLDDVPDQQYWLTWARSSDEALRYIEDGIADVVLLDYRLESADGVSIAKRVRECGYLAPIIMLTGQPNLEADPEAMQAGIVDYLSKQEISSYQLDRSIRYALAQARSVAFAQSEYKFLRNALDSLPQSIAILNQDGEIVAVNEGWKRFADENSGTMPAYGIGVNYLDVCKRVEGRHAFDAVRVVDAIRRTLAGQDVDFILEYPCHSDEEERWYSMTVARFHTPSEPHVTITHEDVTRRILAERELLSIAHTMETLIDSSPAAIIGVDEEARVMHWNPAAESIFGWKKHEVIGRFNPILPPDERNELLEVHRKILGGEVIVGREGRRLARDGRLVPVHISVAPITSPDRTARGGLAILVDLTSRVRAEEELRRREQQYRALVENLPDIVVRYDRDLRRIFGNAAANKLLPPPPGSTSISLREAGLPPHEALAWQRRLREVFNTGEACDVEWQATSNGRHYESRIVPEFAPDGLPESALVVSRDITERKLREDERLVLNEASSRLASTLDLEATLKTIMELMVPRFADVCSVSLFDDGGLPIRRVALVKSGERGAVVTDPAYMRHEIEPTGAFGVSHVYRTGQPSVHEYIDAFEVVESLAPVALREPFLSMDVRSAMFVPLTVRDRVIGALAFNYCASGRRYTEADLQFALDLANRAAIAIDNARLHQDLEQSEKRYRTLVEQIPAVVFTTGVDDLSTPLYLSPQIEQVTGYRAGDLIAGKPGWYEIILGDDREHVEASDRAIRASGHARTLEYRLVTRDGRIIWVREEARLIYDEAGAPSNWQGILSDVTVQKELESQLTHQAFHDPLTGLPNRALFNDRVNHAFERRARLGASIAVCFMDLDNFKVINDSLGHGVGDELLVHVGARLQDSLDVDDTAARFGGDEFALLLEGITNTASALRIVKRIVSAFDSPFWVCNRELFVTPSIGVSIVEPDDPGHRDLLREADAAMYKAKRAGKARFELYSPSLTEDAIDRFELEIDLRKTLNGEQLELHYQPLVELASGRIVGAEALVRWNHPVHGLIAPDRFIPVAEETGIIVELGRWILEESCRRVQSWNEHHGTQPPLHLSVNLSARQFSDEMLVEDVRRILDETGYDPELLCLEITESVMMDDEDAAAQMLGRLRSLGVRLAVDDFGTGYSSLSSLRRFPVDQLKIDRSFVDGLLNDPNHSVIVSGVIGMAHALNLEVVAEGVETAEQRDQLIELNCDRAQGYLFSRPLQATVFERHYISPALIDSDELQPIVSRCDPDSRAPIRLLG